MIVATDAVLAMRCPECGKLEYHDFSRFSFSAGKAVSISCSCGITKLVVSTRDCSSYRLVVPCLVCETRHVREVPGRVLWSGGLFTLACPDTDLDLGYIGGEKAVKEKIAAGEEEMEALVEEFGCDGYFHNAKIMFEVLNCLHEIADHGALYCQCGNKKIEVDLFPDRLELHCKNCDSINIIYAETEDDLKVIQQVDTIELARHGFKFLDSKANAEKLKKNKRKRNKT
ncbi:MAG: hypothetical protein K6T29_06825 [Peptococcaceae bacterium]|nr:hypothetical protein [Peptococcaceae bacterium]